MYIIMRGGVIEKDFKKHAYTEIPISLNKCHKGCPSAKIVRPSKANVKSLLVATRKTYLNLAILSIRLGFGDPVGIKAITVKSNRTKKKQNTPKVR